MYVGDRGIARGRDFTGRLPRFARGPRCTASSGTPTSVDRRRRRYRRATFENSPPIGATLTSVTHADVGTRALRRSPCRHAQWSSGCPVRANLRPARAESLFRAAQGMSRTAQRTSRAFIHAGLRPSSAELPRATTTACVAARHALRAAFSDPKGAQHAERRRRRAG